MTTLRVTLLRSAARFVDLWPEIAALRERCGETGNVFLDPLHFLASTSGQRRPLCAACWQDDRLLGLLFCTEHRIAGWPTGYGVAGDFTGRGALLCLPEDEGEVLRASVAHLLASGIHSLHVRHVPRETGPRETGPRDAGPRVSGALEFPALAVRQFDVTISGDRMPLGPSYEHFLGLLGQHTRRNLRYYRRKAEEQGITFDPAVPAPEFSRERDRLNRRSRFSAEAAHMERDDRWMALHRGGHRMALRSASGQAIALLCGFRHRGCFYLLTQWNDRSLASLSLSNVLRAFLAEHLIAIGVGELVFVGGTTIAFGRFCPPHRYQLLLVDRERGLLSQAKRLLALACRRRAERGNPLPFPVETLAGSYLDHARLVERTALGYALDEAAQALEGAPANPRAADAVSLPAASLSRPGKRVWSALLFWPIAFLLADSSLF